MAGRLHTLPAALVRSSKGYPGAVSHAWLACSLLAAVGMSRAQSIPYAPPAPACSWEADGTRSDCRFKHATAGTPTSVAGNRVIVFRRSMSGGHGDSRAYLDRAVNRLAARYGFTAAFSEDPAIFSAESLATAKVVIMNNGEGDAIPAGKHRTALEDFQQVNGWGVIWIHSACSFITSAWPFGQISCVQGFHRHTPPGMSRRMFVDSGTASSPDHGRRNPESEFLLRDLPGWDGKRALQMTDEWFCFKAPARNTAGVNVLFGYDRSSGFTTGGCPDVSDTSETASQNHNMVWTRKMGAGIALFNAWGHEESAYTGNGNMGDSLLWRFIRYAAKDWCVSGSGEPGCDAGVAVRAPEAVPGYPFRQGDGVASLFLPGAERYSVSFADVAGRIVASRSVQGPGKLDVPGLRRGLYLVRIGGKGPSRVHRIMAL